MSEWDGCYCGEFAQPTIAPDEFGETCFHEHDKCEVPTTKVPDQTVIRLLRQKVDRMTERARKVEAAIARVLELHTSEAPDGYEYEFDMTVRGGHWVQCDCCDSANCCDKAVRTCLACGDDMPCPTIRALDGDGDE